MLSISEKRMFIRDLGCIYEVTVKEKLMFHGASQHIRHGEIIQLNESCLHLNSNNS